MLSVEQHLHHVGSRPDNSAMISFVPGRHGSSTLVEPCLESRLLTRDTAGSLKPDSYSSKNSNQGGGSSELSYKAAPIAARARFSSGAVSCDFRTTAYGISCAHIIRWPALYIWLMPTIRWLLCMSKIYQWFSDTDSSPKSRGTSNDAGSKTRSAPSSISFGCSTATYTTQSTTGRRKRSQSEHDDDGDYPDDEDGRGSKRRKAGLSQEDSQDLRFACPFRKHDPQTYGIHGPYTRCALVQLKTVPRVKEHLFRSHIAPIHCERCLTKFRSVVALDTHRRVENACQLKNGERPKGITLAQERQLRNRKKNSVGQTDEERWMEIWTVLFPNDPCPQSPYFEQVQEEVPQPGLVDINDYREYVSRELPSLFQSQIAPLVEGRTQTLGESVDRLQRVFQQCQEELLSNYNLGRTGNRTEPIDNSRAVIRNAEPSLEVTTASSNGSSYSTHDFGQDCIPRPLGTEEANLNFESIFHSGSPSQLATAPHHLSQPTDYWYLQGPEFSDQLVWEVPTEELFPSSMEGL